MNLCLALSLLIASPGQAHDLKAFDGDWVFLEDRTEGRTLEQLTPPMNSKFTLKTEEGALILVYGHGGSSRNVRVALNSPPIELPGTADSIARYSATWKEGVLAYEIVYVRKAGGGNDHKISREFRLTPEGMIVRSNLISGSVGLYRHPQDIPMPSPAKAVIGDIAWLSGNWTGSRGTSGTTTIEERWGPAKGGSMLATSRTVSRDRLSAFEYLRIIERDGGLVYVAQPNGGTATEFVMTEFTAKRAVFDNPRHDYPKRIVYELAEDGRLTATIGFMKGGTPSKFAFKREGN